MNCPDSLMLNNKARISASIDGVNLAGRVIRVVLEDEGEALDEVELTLDEIEGGQEVEFEFRPTDPPPGPANGSARNVRSSVAEARKLGACRAGSPTALGRECYGARRRSPLCRVPELIRRGRCNAIPEQHSKEDRWTPPTM